MNIKALIFDLGGVIFNYSFSDAFSNWSKRSGKSLDEIRSLLRHFEEFEKLERDEITQDQFVLALSKLLQFEISQEIFEADWNSIYLESVANIDKLLSCLRKDYRIVALTNTNKTHAKIWMIKYAEILKYFEKIFSSHEIHARKPEARSFHIVLDYLNLQPSEVVFLDDKKQHIDRASQLGLNCIWVESYDQMILDLSKYDINFKK